MENVNTLTLKAPGYPNVLSHIPQPPKKLFYLGAQPNKWLDKPRVAIVGSRKISAYGRTVTERLAGELARAGVVIISGLAFGVDAMAHQAALEAGGLTAAVLPTSLSQIYPASHLNLARRIVQQGGTLLSEYSVDSEVYRSNFIERNRLVSGLADILLITEAAINSGSLHTARFALDQGKTVMTVPGNITNPGSEGCNNLIKSGAVPVTSADDVFFALGIHDREPRPLASFEGSPEEKAILRLLERGIDTQEELAVAAKLDGAVVSSALTMLEVAGVARPQGGGRWARS